jgi:hypothetical protein
LLLGFSFSTDTLPDDDSDTSPDDAEPEPEAPDPPDPCPVPAAVSVERWLGPSAELLFLRDPTLLLFSLLEWLRVVVVATRRPSWNETEREFGPIAPLLPLPPEPLLVKTWE